MNTDENDGPKIHKCKSKTEIRVENKEMQIPLRQLTDRNDRASWFFHTFDGNGSPIK